MWPFKKKPKVSIENCYSLIDIIPKDYNGIILEVGKRYNLRCGEVVKIVSEAHSPYTFLDENSRCYWWWGRTYEGFGESMGDIVGDAINWAEMR